MNDLDYALTKKGKGRVNALVLNRMDIPVSRMIAEAADEADLIKALNEIETPPMNPEVKMWTVREVV